MRRPRSTYFLIGAFFAALLALWGLERAGILTEAERLRRRDRVLPDLVDLDPADVRRVEIAREDGRLIFDRRGPRRWLLADPAGVDAAPEEVERLIATLQGLRRSPEAGEVDGPAAAYGLAQPEATVRLWNDPSGPPIATLELGRVVQQERFVRPGPEGAVAVVAARALVGVERPAVEWRETAPVPARAFPIAGVTFRREGLEATVERGRRGTWHLTSPVKFPADGHRIERLFEALGALRVDPKARGFVVDRAPDPAAYGLAPPVATIELKTADPEGEPLVLMVGSSPPDRPDDVYVRVGGRDDVMTVDGRFRRELPESLKDLRSRRVADLEAMDVDRIEIEGPGGPFKLARDSEGWSLAAPLASRADRTQIDALLKAVEDLHTSDFFDPGTVGEPEVDHPSRRLRMWQSAGDGRASAADSPPAFSLAIGRHDVLRKVVFARTEGDTAILALPDLFLAAMPRTAYAFRDKALPAVQPTGLARLTIVRPGRTTVLEPSDPTGAPNRWKMVLPVAADADLGAVTTAIARLSELWASAFVADAVGDLGRFGLTNPLMEVRWESTSPKSAGSTSRSLLIGGPTPDDPSKNYASLTGFPAVFTIDAEALTPFGAEFHETRVLAFRPEAARRLVLRSETRTLAFRRRPQPGSGPTAWVPEPGTPTQGVDLSRFDSLVRALSELRAIRFIQYVGPFPPGAGLGSPRLTITVELEGRNEPVRLRVGSKFLSDWVCAATGDSAEGSAFLLQGPAWEGLILGVEGGLPPIPDDPFAPPTAP